MRAVAVLLLLASLLPLATWIPGGESDPAAVARATDWGLGFALCALIGVLAWFVTRGRPSPDVAPLPAMDPRRERAWASVIAAGAVGVYIAIALGVFSGRPLLIDEIVQVLQARDFAVGRLTHEIPGPRVFFSIMHEVDFGAR